MKKSTRSFFRLHGWGGLLEFFHGYVYGRWPNRYVDFIRGSKKSPGGEKRRRRAVVRGRPRDLGGFSLWLQERYHSKLLRTEEAEKIIRLDRPVVVENPERVVPFAIANRIVLDTPGSLAVMRCPCRETKGGSACGLHNGGEKAPGDSFPGSPLDVCMVVGSPFVQFVVEHGTNGARAITREEASHILRRTSEMGWVHTAWLKDAMGGRFYAICNCCTCCCVGMGAMRKSGFSARYVLPSGYAARVDKMACDACGKCRQSCPFGAISMDGGASVRVEHCYGCGVCRTRCDRGAIELMLEPSRGVPLDVEALKSAEGAGRGAQ